MYFNIYYQNIITNPYNLIIQIIVYINKPYIIEEIK